MGWPQREPPSFKRAGNLNIKKQKQVEKVLDMAYKGNLFRECIGTSVDMVSRYTSNLAYLYRGKCTFEFGTIGAGNVFENKFVIPVLNNYSRMNRVEALQADALQDTADYITLGARIIANLRADAAVLSVLPDATRDSLGGTSLALPMHSDDWESIMGALQNKQITFNPMSHFVAIPVTAIYQLSGGNMREGRRPCYMIPVHRANTVAEIKADITSLTEMWRQNVGVGAPWLGIQEFHRTQVEKVQRWTPHCNIGIPILGNLPSAKRGAASTTTYWCGTGGTVTDPNRDIWWPADLGPPPDLFAYTPLLRLYDDVEGGMIKMDTLSVENDVALEKKPMASAGTAWANCNTSDTPVIPFNWPYDNAMGQTDFWVSYLKCGRFYFAENKIASAAAWNSKWVEYCVKYGVLKWPWVIKYKGHRPLPDPKVSTGLGGVATISNNIDIDGPLANLVVDAIENGTIQGDGFSQLALITAGRVDQLTAPLRDTLGAPTTRLLDRLRGLNWLPH